MFDIDFYRLPDGTAPVEEFLDTLTVKMRNKALDSLLILEEFGNSLREPYSKYMGNGLFELWIQSLKLARQYKADYEHQSNITVTHNEQERSRLK